MAGPADDEGSGSATGFSAALATLPAAEWAAAIVVRHSARTYTGQPVDQAELRHLEDLCAKLPAPEIARVVVVPDVPDAVFRGFVGSYGKVLHAPSALLMIGDLTQPSVHESVGYLGEATVLEATSRGLGTCWIAGYFDRTLASGLVPLRPGEQVVALSPLGTAQSRPRTGERVLKRVVGAHKRRPIEEIAPGFDEDHWPAWAAEGVRLGRVAPSAVNRQPWRFTFGSEEITPGQAGPGSPVSGTMTISAVTKGSEGNVSRRLDCGIAMLHFQVGAALMGVAGRWESLAAPQVARYLVTASFGES